MQSRSYPLSVLALSFAALCSTSCGGFFGECSDASPEAEANVSLPMPWEGLAGLSELPEGAHPVVCGCVVPGINRCGNYVAIDGEAVPLAGDIGLGKMEYCGQGVLTANLEGAVEDGAFIATGYELRP